jgi:DNA-binding transcriptional regulator YhcF (GntR family)
VLEISLDSPVPLGDQLVAGFRQLIASGTLKPGDELPPVRQLAADLGVNLNTVARAYRELEAAGLAIAARGRGTRVTATREAAPGTAASTTRAAPPPPTIAATTALHDAVARVLTDAKLSGFSPDEVRSCIERMVPHYWPDTAPRFNATNPGAHS